MKRLIFWTAGIALGLWAVNQLRGGRALRRLTALDLNQCSREDLLAIPGLTASLVDRIIDNRPYHHRLDLVARMVIPSGIYQTIRDRVDVSAAAAKRPINVAS
ncbi:MAG TPA: hypothetical protein VGL89_14450 [Candidatus Koribacter sp.]|jgi:hypothetical protein